MPRWLVLAHLSRSGPNPAAAALPLGVASIHIAAETGSLVEYSVVKLENLEGQIFRLKQFGCKMVSKILLSAVYFAMRSDVGILTVPPSRKFAAPIHEAKIYPPTEKTEFCNRIWSLAAVKIGSTTG